MSEHHQFIASLFSLLFISWSRSVWLPRETHIRCKRKYEEITIKTVYCKKNDVPPSVAVYLCFRQDSTNARIHFGAVPAGISRLRADFESADERTIESARASERLGRKKNRFINSIRFPLHFSSVLRLSPSPCPEMVPPRDGREYPRQSSLFARSGAVSLFVIASNFSGRYPVGDKARNLNKTNQYSNPPLSLADSPSVPFSAFFFSSFFFTSPFIDFYSSLFPAASPTPSATFLSGLSLSFAPILHSLVQYRGVHLFASLCRRNRAISFPDPFNLCTHWISIVRMIGFILGENRLRFIRREEEKIQDKEIFSKITRKLNV